jgi:hypothetical protein
MSPLDSVSSSSRASFSAVFIWFSSVVVLR